MTLQDYIIKHGVGKVARQVGVTRRTVEYWRLRQTYPQRRFLNKMLNMGLSIKDIYG